MFFPTAQSRFSRLGGWEKLLPVRLDILSQIPQIPQIFKVVTIPADWESLSRFGFRRFLYMVNAA